MVKIIKIGTKKVNKEIEFKKEQLVNASEYKDILSALVDENKKYTYQNINDTVEEYMKGEVK